jgi:hypothetical protein
MDTYKQIDLIDQCYGSLSGYIENQLGFKNFHVNLPYLQGKKIKTSISLFIGDRMKFNM